MNIQRLSPTHAHEYRALMLEAYALHPDSFVSTLAERAALPLGWWESRIQAGPEPSELVLGSFQQGQLAGVVGLSFESREKERQKAKLFGLYVRSACRRNGIGRQLVLAVLLQARARPGVKAVRLTVTETNRAAQALYERAGFIQFGLEPFAIAVGGEFVSMVHMWCHSGDTQGGEQT